MSEEGAADEEACAVGHPGAVDDSGTCLGGEKMLSSMRSAGASSSKGRMDTTTRLFATQLTKVPGAGANNVSSSLLRGGEMVIVAPGGCECDLVSMDCLSSIRCIVRGRESQKLIALGVTTRKILKETSKWGDGPILGRTILPMGKMLQYGTIEAWTRWAKENTLPWSLGNRLYRFIGHDMYDFCGENGLTGNECYFGHNATADEDLGDLESAAIAREPVPGDAVEMIRSDLADFREKIETEPGRRLPALGYLVAFAHILRIRFHRQRPVLDLYSKYAASVSHHHGTATDDQRLRVGLHIRRADACDHRRRRFERRPAKFTDAFPSSKRKCYATSVYVEALRRIQKEAGIPLDVYLSTDDAGEILQEMEKDFPAEYGGMNWHFLNISRDVFDYKKPRGQSFIEAQSLVTQAHLGETAVLDLWLLSHAQAFVGHLGSRFGKVSWLLSTARHNAFVPFYSVDGHSFCCEVDESCGDMKPYITSMKDCLTFMHDYYQLGTGVQMNLLNKPKMNKDYWEVGSQMRRIVAEKLVEDRRKMAARKEDNVK